MKKLALAAIFGISCLGLSFNSHAEQTPAAVKATEQPLKIEVYRSATCSCCGKWLEHLKQNNFQVDDHIVDDVQAVKDKYGVPKEMASCHTALVNGYVVEGHVPANDIRKLLNLKPKVIGIAAPGMPTGSPGMEVGDKQDTYNVMSFDKDKHFEVFSHHEGK
jgi:hypothetical protein